MTNIILDSNILFSALRGKESKTRSKLLNKDFKFYAPNFLMVEIFKYKDAIIKKSNNSEEETLKLLTRLLYNINFVNEENISTVNFITAYRLCKDIDEKDTPFVALSIELGYKIWTRDAELKKGLILKGFDQFYDEKS